jgi:hypothetical protein
VILTWIGLKTQSAPIFDPLQIFGSVSLIPTALDLPGRAQNIPQSDHQKLWRRDPNSGASGRVLVCWQQIQDPGSSMTFEF